MQKGPRSSTVVNTSRRLFTPRPAGIPRHADAPFWRGETAEQLIAERVAAHAAAQDAKRAARSGRRSSRGPGSPRSPSVVLRRLERALGRRKTLAARMRLKQQIAALKAEHTL